MNINNSQTEAILVATQVAQQYGKAIMLSSLPGCGKSAFVAKLAESMELPLLVVVGAVHDPTDFNGLPYVHKVDAADPQVFFLIAQFFEDFILKGKGILFIDELTGCSPAVQFAILRLLNEGYVGQTKIPKGIIKMTAANPAQSVAGMQTLSSATANRLMHFDFEVSPEDFRMGLRTQWKTGLSLPRIKPATELTYQRAATLVAGFLQANPTLIHQLPADEEEAGRAWPSHRSWETLIFALAVFFSNYDLTSEKNKNIAFLLIKSSIGSLDPQKTDSVGEKFYKYICSENVEFKDIFSVGFELDKLKNPNLAYRYVGNAVSSYFQGYDDRTDEENNERFQKLTQLFQLAIENKVDGPIKGLAYSVMEPEARPGEYNYRPQVTSIPFQLPKKFKVPGSEIGFYQEQMKSLEIAMEISKYYGKSIMLWSPPGMGKTATITKIAQQKNWPILVVIGAVHDPSDFNGLPCVVVDGTQPKAEYVIAQFFQDLFRNKEAVLFIDEFSGCSPAVQLALLRLLNEGYIGQTKIPKGIIKIAAANPASTVSGASELSAATANRFLHFDFRIPTDIATLGYLTRWACLPGTPPTNLTEDKIQEYYGLAADLVCGFLTIKPQFMHHLPADELKAGGAWPSNRTWETLVFLLAGIMAVSNNFKVKKEFYENIALRLMVATIGESVAMEFFEYSKNLDLPDPEMLIKNPTLFQRFDRDDKTHTVLDSIVAAYVRGLVAFRATSGNVPNREQTQRYYAVWEILGRAAEQGCPDIAAVPAMLLRTEEYRPAGASNSVHAAKFYSMLVTAGLIKS